MARQVSGSTNDRIPLSRDLVLAGAIRVADAGGIGALTIRTLAQELGVKPISVYHYVATRTRSSTASLISSTARSIYRSPAPTGGPR